MRILIIISRVLVGSLFIVSGLIKASRCVIEPPHPARKDYLGIMEELARFGEDAYRELIGSEGLLDYFYEVTPVDAGSRTLKDAINEAIRDWVTNVETTHYLLGSALGPHPYPRIVRDFQRIIGDDHIPITEDDDAPTSCLEPGVDGCWFSPLGVRHMTHCRVATGILIRYLCRLGIGTDDQDLGVLW